MFNIRKIVKQKSHGHMTVINDTVKFLRDMETTSEDVILRL